MTDDELFGCFDHEYIDGVPQLQMPSQGAPKSEYEYFKRHCELNCVTDSAVIAELWAAKPKKSK